MLLSAFSDKTCKFSLEEIMQSIIYAVSVSIQSKYMNTSNSFTNKSNVQYLHDMHFANPAEPSQRFLHPENAKNSSKIKKRNGSGY